jgi:hypothetical protein
MEEKHGLLKAGCRTGNLMGFYINHLRIFPSPKSPWTKCGSGGTLYESRRWWLCNVHPNSSISGKAPRSLAVIIAHVAGAIWLEKNI